MVCPPEWSRLRKDDPDKFTCTASSFLAAGQVGPDIPLLTLIDPWFVLLNGLDSEKTIPINLLAKLLHFLSRVRLVQIFFC